MVCSEFCKERKKREDERKRMIISMGKKSPKGGAHQTNEQRSYQSKIKDLRIKCKTPLLDGNESDNKNEIQASIDKTRQPNLVGLTPEYDLKLFLEAQAAASEKIVRLF